MKLAILIFVVTMLSTGMCIAQPKQTTHGNCSPTFGSVGGNAVVNICAGEKFSSAQEALLVASHPTTTEVTDLRFQEWFEDGLVPFLTVVLTNKSDVPAIGVTVEVMDLHSGNSYPKLKPLKVGESGVFKRTGSTAVSVAANASEVYPLVSASDIVKIVHPEVPSTFCPYDASVLPMDHDEMMREHARLLLNQRSASGANADDQPASAVATSRPMQEIGTLLRIKYQTIFGQHITSYATIFVDYADIRFNGDVWYPSKKAYGELRCVESQQIDPKIEAQ